MTAMDKATIIFGEKKSVPIASFKSSQLKDIENAIEDEIGAYTLRGNDVMSLVAEAKADPALQGGYVKVGVVSGNLVFRCQDKNSVTRSFRDLILVKNYTSKQSVYTAGQVAALRGHKESAAHFDGELADRWNDRSVGAVSRPVAESILAEAGAGAWFVRQGTGDITVISYRKGSGYAHEKVARFADLGLSQEHYLSPLQVERLLKVVHERESAQPEAPGATQVAVKSKLLDAQKVVALAAIPGFYKKLGRDEAGKLLKGKPANTWLIRASDSKKGEIVWAHRVDKKTVQETLDNNKYDAFQGHASAHAALQIKA